MDSSSVIFVSRCVRSLSACISDTCFKVEGVWRGSRGDQHVRVVTLNPQCDLLGSDAATGGGLCFLSRNVPDLSLLHFVRGKIVHERREIYFVCFRSSRI